MEDKYQLQEIKIMDGVYLWKNTSNDHKSENNDQMKATHTNNKNSNTTKLGNNDYICNSREELVKIYETEFEELGEKVHALFQSNEEMLAYDPHDYDLMQAREENLEIIDKKLSEMIQIQKNMKEICPHHPLINIDIFEYFGIGKSIDGKKSEDNILNKNNNSEIENTGKDKSKEVEDKNNKNVANDNILTEIEL